MLLLVRRLRVLSVIPEESVVAASATNGASQKLLSKLSRIGSLKSPAGAWKTYAFQSTAGQRPAVRRRAEIAIEGFSLRGDHVADRCNAASIDLAGLWANAGIDSIFHAGVLCPGVADPSSGHSFVVHDPSLLAISCATCRPRPLPARRAAAKAGRRPIPKQFAFSSSSSVERPHAKRLLCSLCLG